MLSPSLIFNCLVVLAAGAGKATDRNGDPGPVAVNVTTSSGAERISLAPLRGPIELVVDPLGARIELLMKKPQPALVTEVARHAGSICPVVVATTTGLELHCRTRRFEAILSVAGSKTFLDIQELRGLPWRDGPFGPPFFHYEPFRSGLGAICPGAIPVARGECALLLGHQLEAATYFRSAVDSGDRPMAALRLGDLALATGDPATAIGWYRRAGGGGGFGRMARTRVCELEGTCLASTEVVRRVFDSRGLPAPLRAEMNVRAIRAEAFSGRFDSAIRMLWQLARGDWLAETFRAGGEELCRRVLLEAMRELLIAPPGKEGDAATPPAEAAANVVAVSAGAAETTTGAKPSPAATRGAARDDARAEEKDAELPDDPSVPEMAIEVFLSLPQWDRGLLTAELSQSAADLAKRLGAPVFGGNILSVVAPQVAPAALSAHLLQAAELYLDGDDIARTRLVMEYARTRVVRPMSARWIALEKRLAARVAQEDEEEDAAAKAPAKVSVDAQAVSREIAAARAVSALARLARAETSPPKQGDKP